MEFVSTNAVLVQEKRTESVLYSLSFFCRVEDPALSQAHLSSGLIFFFDSFFFLQKKKEEIPRKTIEKNDPTL
jgi:hypothetical protein